MKQSIAVIENMFCKSEAECQEFIQKWRNFSAWFRLNMLEFMLRFMLSKQKSNVVSKVEMEQFFVIVYIALRIHVIFDYMNHNIGFSHGKYLML